MARHRKTEPSVIVSATGAAPARRKAATPSQKSRPSVAPEANAAVTELIATESITTESIAAEPTAVQFLPAQEQIAKLAYSYWVSRGYQGGCPQEDWLRAEQELLETGVSK